MAIAKRTPLFDRNPQYGWYDYGNFEKHPANIWFVGNCATGSTARADAAGFGMSPDSPFLTIQYAVNQCANSTGDVIYVLPGHVEAVAAAAGLALNKIGITIIGIGEGTYQPIISLDAELSDVDIDAASVTVEHMVFRANFADVSAAIDVNASDFTLRNCRCVSGGANLNAEIWVQDGALLTSHRITIEDCIFIDNDAANDECLAFGGTGAEHVVRRNNFVGTWGTACISVTGACTYMLIADNNVYNIQAAVVDTGINAATATGICVNNRASTGNASVNQITAPAMVKCQNYGGLIGDNNGPLEPVAT
jgi:hypothetical protein